MRKKYCLRYRINNLQKIRISDDSSSIEGQTETLRYLTGSSMRGIVIQQFVDDQNFESELKAIFLSESTVFTNAYPTENGEALLPSPRGFYEDKSKPTEIEHNLLAEKFPSGWKRADLGDFCKLDPKKNKIFGYRVPVSERLNIKVHQESSEKKIFRDQFIQPDLLFEGYIFIESEEIANQIIKKLKQQCVYVGGNKSSGFGKSIIKEIELIDTLPYQNYALQQVARDEVFMMALSNLAMRDTDSGEITGICPKTLANILGVTDLKMAACETTVQLKSASNSTWGCRTPAIPMYGAGSLFHLKFTGEITKEKMQQVSFGGIGVRRNEGCGQVLFVDQLVKMRIREEAEYLCGVGIKETKPVNVRAEDRQVLLIAARQYYQNKIEHAKNAWLVKKSDGKMNFIESMSNSQLGQIADTIASIKIQLHPDIDGLKAYLCNQEREERLTYIQEQFINGVLKYLDQELFAILQLEDAAVMGFEITELFDQSEQDKHKLDLLERKIRLKNRNEKGGTDGAK